MLQYEQSLIQAIANVKNDHLPINWVVVGHVDGDPNHVQLVGTGSQGLDEMKELLKIDQVQYGLIRITTQVDLSSTIKFVYVYNMGEQVRFALKGRFGVMHGQIRQLFQPWHVDFEISNPNELQSELVERKVMEACGTANKVRDTRQVEEANVPSIQANVQSRQVNAKLDKQFNANKSTKLSIDASLIAALKEIRVNEMNWLLACYDQNNIKNQIVLECKGTNGANELKQHLLVDHIQYGLVKVIDKIDGHPTVKFCMITWIGSQVPMMTKAKIATHKGAVSEHFGPFHVDLTIGELEEISDLICLNQVQSFSGSKSFVK